MKFLKMMINMSLILLTPAAFAGGMNMAQIHVGHVYKSWKDTPNQVGFLTILQEELAIFRTHVELAARKSDDLAWLKLHTGHIRHAIDPTTKSSGPGKGYGVIKAAMGVKAHITFAGQSEGATPNIKLHATHIAASAGNIAQWGKDVSALTDQLLASTSTNQAASMLKEIGTILERMEKGYDADGNGAISWNEGEGGFTQTDQHLNLLMKGENMMFSSR
jgi:hypothetical protein